MDRTLFRSLVAVAAASVLALACASSAQALGKPVAIGANATSLPSQAAVAVDSAGVAYIAWDDPVAAASQPSSTVMEFCKVAIGATGCSPIQLKVPDPAHAQFFDPPSVLVNGTDVYVFEYVDGAPNNDDGMNEWVSLDGGASFTRVGDAMSFSFVGDTGGTGPMPVIRLLNDNVGIGYVSAVDNPLFQANSLIAPLNYSKGSAPPAPFATLNPSPDNYTIGNGGGEFASQLSGTTGVLGVFEMIETGPCPSNSGLVFAYAPLSGTTTNSQLETTTGLPGSPWQPLKKMTCNADAPAVTSGPAGLGVLDTNGATNAAQYRTFTAPGTFGSPVTVASEAAHQPTVSQDSAGGLYATWLSNGTGIRLAYSSNRGAAWAGPSTLVASKGMNAGVDSVASDVGSSGDGWAVYASQGKEYAVQFNAGEAFLRPRISHLKFKPARFSSKHGSKVSYSDSQPALTTFKVVERKPGYRLAHGRCKPLKKGGVPPAHSRSCTADQIVKSFKHPDLKGSNSFAFTARAKGHKLAPASYELRATPKLGSLKGKTVSIKFTIS
jgi:hypothetical protein